MNETAMQDVSAQAAQPPEAGGLPRPKRLPNQSCYRPPKGANPARAGEPLGWSQSVVPVSSVARDWGVSARRVRVMLTTPADLLASSWPMVIGRCFTPIATCSAHVGLPLSASVICRPSRKKQERMKDW